MEYHKNFSIDPIVKEIKGIVYTERWLPIERFKNYTVSTFGRFFSIRDQKIMKQYQNEKGYLNIGLYNEEVKKKFKSHRIVAIMFNINPENKPQVNHDDFDKTNNFYLNLLWATGKENTNHAQIGGKMPIKIYKPNPVLTFGKIVCHKKIIDTDTGIIYDSVRHLAGIIGCGPKELQRKINGERKNNTPYRYEGSVYKYREKENEQAYIRFTELRDNIYKFE